MNPDQHHTSILLPGSKSISNRLLLIKAIGELDFEIGNISNSDDTLTLQKVLKEIDTGSAILDVSHAGTNMRFLCSYLSTLENKSFTITGSDRMKQRPVEDLVTALTNLGADIKYLEKEGFPPLQINGKKLHGSTIEINASVSSQFITSILLISPYFKNGLTIKLIGKMVSPSYIKLTTALMQLFGILIKWENNCISVSSGNYTTNSPYIYNESDWSAASYFYSASSISDLEKIELNGLTKNSLQPDSKVADVFTNFGVTTTFYENKVQLQKTKLNLKHFEYDFTDCPDIAQTIAVTCFALGVTAKLTGLQTLKIKETDRIVALKNELEKLGAIIETTSHSLEIKHIQLIDKNSKITINTYNDHRMAMSFAPLLKLFPNLEIENKEVVSKSFPKFWDEFSKLYPTK